MNEWENKMSTKNHRTKRIVFGMVFAALLFVAADTVYRVIARFAYEESYYPFEDDEELGLRHIPGSSGTVTARGTEPHTVSFNRFGFRGPRPETEEKSEGVVRIGVLGASTSENIYVADGNTWPEHLERNLRLELDTDRIEVINMAVSGYTLRNAVRSLRLHGLRFRPDLVIVYSGVNDFVNGLQGILGPGYKRDQRFIPYYDREASRVESLLCKSVILDHLNRFVYEVRYHRQKDKYRIAAEEYLCAPDKITVDLDADLTAPAREAYRDLLRMSRKHGFRIAVARQATLVQSELPPEHAPQMWDLVQWRSGDRYVAWDTYVAGYAMLRDTHEKFARRNGLLFIDAEAGVPKDPEYFIDHVHFTPKGTERVGSVIAKGLLESGALQELLTSQSQPTET